MSKIHPMKKIALVDLKLNPDNPRSVEELDVQSMIDSILSKGSITDPLHVEFETGFVLRGNRRFSAAKELVARPNCPADIKEKLTKLQVIYYEGLNEKERLELIHDHGDTKPLGRVDTVKAVWSLQKQMFTFSQIINTMFHLLARFTGNTGKAYEAQKLPAGGGRSEFLIKWFKGTVQDYLLTAGTLSQTLKEQLLLTEKDKDRPLSDEDKKKVLFWVNREVVQRLKKAMNKDKESPEGWDSFVGGKEYNMEWEKLCQEYIHGKAPSEVPAPTKKQMEAFGDGLRSPIKLAYRHCAGLLAGQQVLEIEALDTELTRIANLKAAIRPYVDLIQANAVVGGGELKELLTCFLSGTEVEMEKIVKQMVMAK